VGIVASGGIVRNIHRSGVGAGGIENCCAAGFLHGPVSHWIVIQDSGVISCQRYDVEQSADHRAGRRIKGVAGRCERVAVTDIIDTQSAECRHSCIYIYRRGRCAAQCPAGRVILNRQSHVLYKVCHRTVAIGIQQHHRWLIFPSHSGLPACRV